MSGWRLWWFYFSYPALLALVVQLVALPRVVPAWHAGNGLLIGGDWLRFHQLGAELAERIHTEGWSAWELQPDGQAPVGIAAAVYSIVGPLPLALIPINAALHATAALVLTHLVLMFLPSRRQAIWASMPFLVYPSAMLWYTQIGKDGFAIAGSLLFVYGWARLAQRQTSLEGPRRLLLAGLSVTLGIGLVWIVRPYEIEVMQAVAVGLALVIAASFLIRAFASRIPLCSTVVGLLIVVALIGMMVPIPKYDRWSADSYQLSSAAHSDSQLSLDIGVVNAHTQLPEDSWRPSGLLPQSIDQKLRGLAIARRNSRTIHPTAPSNLDAHVGFGSARDLIVYLPRVVQIAFLAPFPSQWYGQGTQGPSAVMRGIAGLEMLGVYLALIQLPYAVWRWRRRPELWVILLFCVSMMVIHALAVVNTGSLYRVRYGYIMTLVALGACGWMSVWSRLRARRLHLRVPLAHD